MEKPVERKLLVSQPQLLTTIIIENKRDMPAWLDSNRCCVVHPDNLALNLLDTDIVIPNGCWARRTIWRLPVNPAAINMWMLGPAVDSPPNSGIYRVILKMIWEDDRSETVDLSYEIEEKYPGAEDN